LLQEQQAAKTLHRPLFPTESEIEKTDQHWNERQQVKREIIGKTNHGKS
jgi:hypothetical protein